MCIQSILKPLNQCELTSVESKKFHVLCSNFPGVEVYRDDCGRYRFVFVADDKIVSALLIGPDLEVQHALTQEEHQRNGYYKSLWAFANIALKGKVKHSQHQTEQGKAASKF